MTREELEQLTDEEAKKRGIHPALARAVIEKESGWDPSAVSGSGARGLMQLMPETAKELGVGDSFNPEENLRGGLDYLKQQIDEFGVPKGLAAYNWGPGNTRRKLAGLDSFDQIKGSLPSETQNYIPGVLAKAKELGFSPDSGLQKPDFSSITKSDALDGDNSPVIPDEQKKEGWFGRIFGASRAPETVDQYGNKKPGELKEGIGRKILSFAAPLLFGAFPNPVMAALNVALNNKRNEDFTKAGLENKAYQEVLKQSQKEAEPSEAIKKFRDWKNLSDEDKEKYKKMQESTLNPLSMMNLNYRQERDAIEDTRKSETDKKNAALKLRDDETSFRKEYEASPVVKDFNMANTGIKKIREAMKSPTQDGFNDMSLVFNYMKVLDPGSVVREGEYATAMKNASLLESLGVRLNRVMTGQQLSPEQRKLLTAAAERQFNSNRSTYQNYKAEKTDIAKKSGLDPTKVITDFENEAVVNGVDITAFDQEDREAIQEALKDPQNPKAKLILKHFGIGGA